VVATVAPLGDDALQANAELVKEPCLAVRAVEGRRFGGTGWAYVR
jgi:hypothetical protein